MIIQADREWRSVLIVFASFFVIGFWQGPFLEPPSDPLEHLRRIQNWTDVATDAIPKENRGLWHYSMAGTVLRFLPDDNNPARMLRNIDTLHGLFLGLLMSGLYILGLKANFKKRWAVLGCLIAYSFMGTNRFSYFSYYSFAPTYTSMLLLWLWTAAFFFHRDSKKILLGTLCVAMSLPVLWVNHRQEAVFLVFIYGIWMLTNTYFTLVVNAQENFPEKRIRHLPIVLFFSILFILLFLLPQVELVRDLLKTHFIYDRWLENQKLVVSWNGIHLIGRVWGHRVNDTIGNIGLIMVAAGIVYAWRGMGKSEGERKVRIIILAFLPFLMFCVPLFHYIWVSNVYSAEYYRFSYTSMFWLLFGGLAQGLEQKAHLKKTATGTSLWSGEKKGALYFVLCAIIVVWAGSNRFAPIYGKLDFIFLDSKPWWPSWKPMVENMIGQGNRPIYTDPTTSTVLQAVFNQKTLNFRRFTHYPYLNVEIMNSMSRPLYERFPYGAFPLLLREGSRDSGPRIDELPGISYDFMESEKGQPLRNAERLYRCLVNLQGFTPSWVSWETGHWNPTLADTALFYRYNANGGNALVPALKADPPENCTVYY